MIFWGYVIYEDSFLLLVVFFHKVSKNIGIDYNVVVNGESMLAVKGRQFRVGTRITDFFYHQEIVGQPGKA